MNKRSKTFLLILLTGFVAPALLNAAMIVQYQMAANTPTITVPEVSATMLTVNNVDGGKTGDTSDFNYTTAPTPAFDGSSDSGSPVYYFLDSGSTANTFTNFSMDFMLTPDVGTLVSYDTFYVFAASSIGTVNSVELLYDVGNTGTFVTAGTDTSISFIGAKGSPTVDIVSFDISAIGTSSSAVKFRINPIGSNASNVFLDDATITGTVIPEPATAVLVIVGFSIALLSIRKSHR